MERGQDAGERLVLAALTSALLLVLGQALSSRSVLSHLEPAVWLVPTWAVWVLAGAVLALRTGVLPTAAVVLAVAHGLQHLGWATPEAAHLAVEGGLVAVLLLALAQRVRAVRRQERVALAAYLREPLPVLQAPLRGAFAAHVSAPLPRRSPVRSGRG